MKAEIRTGQAEQVMLQTARLYLRRFRAEDAGLLHALDSDPEVMRFITKGQPTPLAQGRGEILCFPGGILLSHIVLIH